MKKSLMAGLTGALLLGVTGTSFAASNPFTDVPRGHWAYDAVEQLRQDGVIEGYGDGTYRGERTITRYEMAQMIARAMDQFDQQVKGLSGQKPVVQNVGADKAMLDRLAAEFADELNSLGVRVSNLEKYSDKIKWNGKIEYTYTSGRYNTNRLDSRDFADTYGLAERKTKTNDNHYVFRLEPNAEINDHWSAHARIDIDGDMKHDATGDQDANGDFDGKVSGKRVWAQGDYDHFQIKAGKIEFYPNEKGLVFDDEISGGQLTYKAGDFSLSAYGGRMDIYDAGFINYLQNSAVNMALWGRAARELAYDAVAEGDYTSALLYANLADNFNAGALDMAAASGDDKANVWGVNAQYAHPTGFEIGAGFYQLKSDAFTEYRVFDGDLYKSNKGKNQIWSVNAGYNFSDKAKLWGSYARSDYEAFTDYEGLPIAADAKYSWQAELDFGNYDDASEKGQWKVYGAYRRYGFSSSIFPTGDGVSWGQKGWEAGVSYAPFKNIGLLAKYFNGEELANGNDAEKLFGRVEFFF